MEKIKKRITRLNVLLIVMIVVNMAMPAITFSQEVSESEATDNTNQSETLDTDQIIDSVTQDDLEAVTNEPVAEDEKTDEKDSEEDTVKDTPMGFYTSGKFGDAEPTEKLIKQFFQEKTDVPINPRARSTSPSDLSSSDTTLPRKDFIDISSYQSWMIQSDFNRLKALGVKGVCVKLTEGTGYRNPYAQSQIAMARAAGLVVSTYHYSHFSTNAQAQAEANYYVAFARELGLSTSTLMVNDAEDPNMTANSADPTLTSLAFQNQLKANGYTNVMHYASASWVGNTSYMEPQKLGAKNIWVAQYLYGKPSNTNLQNTAYAAWQYTSQMYFSGLSKNYNIDTNIDYSGRFTGGTNTPPISNTKTNMLQYRAHNATVGWGSLVDEENVAGTSGKKLEAFQLNLSATGLSGSIEYSAHVQSNGWQSYVSNGELSGTTGASLQVEAIKVRLTGELANVWDIYYKANVGGAWQDWVKNDGISGTVGASTPIYQIQFKLVPKQTAVLKINSVNFDNSSQVLKTETITKAVGTTWTINPTQISGYIAPAAQTVKINSAGSTVNFSYFANPLQSVEQKLQYRTHVQKEGWQGIKENGQTAGTTGKSYRLESLQLAYKEAGLSGDVVYQTHVSTIGWQSAVKNGNMAGTTSQGLPIEAVKIYLTGDLAEKYTIQYRAHVATIGWQPWVENNVISGTTGQKLQMEAIEVRLVPKPYYSLNSTKEKTLQYRAHVGTIGWQDTKENGQTAGTTGKSLRLESLQLAYKEAGLSGDIVYQTHVQSIGWQNEVKNGQTAGTTGKGLRVEAIKIHLTGDLAKKYKIQYRAHVKSVGWQPWVEEGAMSGTTGRALQMEAIEIRLVAK